MNPLCSAPRRFPAPLISRSLIAIFIPLPNSAKSLMALSLFSAISVRTLSLRKVRYAEALLEEYFHETGSKKAALMLSDWEQYRPKFVRIFPVEYRSALARAAR